MKSSRQPVLVVIGGGVTGAAIAYHLDRWAPGAARIVVVEPREAIGTGLAYSSEDPAHRINVPAARMSLDPGDPEQFENWLRRTDALANDPEARLDDGRAFPRRRVFGRYVSDQLDEPLRAGRIEHARAEVVGVARDGGAYRVRLSTGQTIAADAVAIAATHPPPAAPAAIRDALAGDPRLISDSNAPGALDMILPGDRVLIVGTGLTMADIVASLDLRGHAGAIVAVSRNGQLPARHPSPPTNEFGDFVSVPVTSVRKLIRDARAAAARADLLGLPPQAVFDALRNQGTRIWAALDPRQRRILARRVRPFWDARRFRIAPQLWDVLERRGREGRFEALAGGIREVRATPAAVSAILRGRGGARETSRDFDIVVLATGPAHRDILNARPFLRGMEREGWLGLDSVGLGLSTDTRGRSLDRHGQPVERLYIAGPLARGTFGELMGLPEVSRYAVFIANEIAAEFGLIENVEIPARASAAE
jgi:uncharacterized NAD(P)/FAD-binding protein YdhS